MDISGASIAVGFGILMTLALILMGVLAPMWEEVPEDGQPHDEAWDIDDE